MGVDVVLISTRKPTPITCRHDFAVEATVKTQYLFPPKASALASWTLQMCPGLPAALSYLNELSWTGISRRIDHYGLLAAAVVLAQCARRNGIGHIHCHSCANAAHVVAMAKRLGGPPYSLTLHGDLEVYGTRASLQNEERRFCVCGRRRVRDQILAQTDVPSNRVILTCMGADVQELAALKSFVLRSGDSQSANRGAPPPHQRPFPCAGRGCGALWRRGSTFAMSSSGKACTATQLSRKLASLGLRIASR